MEVHVTRLSDQKRSLRRCRTLTFSSWALLVAAFVFGEYFLLGWVGPAPVFVGWSLLALPLTVATLRWLRRLSAFPGRPAVIISALCWMVLLLSAVNYARIDLPDAVGLVFIGGMLIFPIVLTYFILKQIEERTSVAGTA